MLLSLFYGGTVRFAVALGIHEEEPSEQILLATVLTSDQRRKELKILWHSVHVTDLWLTNAIGFTVANGPASAVPIEVIPYISRSLAALIPGSTAYGFYGQRI